jgi:small subunit ribosomal protein S1
VKVLDIDRERQRISLGLKQTQTDPWQQVIDAYQQGDVVEGRVTKVVTFGAFVEVIPGVEGLVHISELAAHHVENPREVVQQGETLRAKIIEMDAERRRLSLSLKRVEEGESVRPGVDGEAPELGLSEEVFIEGEAVAPDVIEAETAEPEAAEIAEVDAAEPEAAETAEPEAAEVADLEAVEAEAVEVEPEAAEVEAEEELPSPEAVATDDDDEAPSADEAAPEADASGEPDDEPR